MLSVSYETANNFPPRTELLPTTLKLRPGSNVKGIFQIY